MAVRPNFIDFRAKSSETMHTGVPLSPRGLSSPKITHMDGDIPPSMSPLDAFAAQSRMLAKKLDDSSRNGRRVSRLPPLTIANSIKVTGPGYLRSRSAEVDGNSGGTKLSPKDEESGNVPEVEEPAFRPQSFYPRMSGVPLAEEDPDDGPDGPDEPEDQIFSTPAEFQPQSRDVPAKTDYFGIARAHSPEPMSSARRILDTNEHRLPSSYQRTFDPVRGMQAQRGPSGDSTSIKSQRTNALAPVQSPRARHAGSIRSVPADSSDDELSASTHGSSFSIHRKQSSSSGVSIPRSPLVSPFAQPHARSPSLNSEYSIGGSRLARPTYNFSRPISRGSIGRPSLDTNSRQPSFDTRPSFDMTHRQLSSDSQRFFLSDDNVQTPMSMKSEHFADARANPDAPAPSYIYAKFSLPRGRMLQRDSEPLDILQMPHFEWEQPVAHSNVQPLTPPTSDHNRSNSPALSHTRSPKPSIEISESPRPSDEHLQPKPRPPPTPLTDDTESRSSASMRSGSTIKARSYSNRAVADARDSRELTPEDHLAKGIASHERGNFKESTYHLRIAAKHNLPTAMLLYALACRHGWGMRPNQQEGVQWLRRAADSASLELADDESKQLKPEEVQQQKARRAQFALSIYELGVSHMNGWGIEQDKALALRCFEIAGNWGDADALAEAGFCYTQGTGCKKDLKKAAKYYRMAEAKGMSMVGNSWFVPPHLTLLEKGARLIGSRIYKPKYADGSNDRQGRGVKPTTPEKKPRDKSRTRTIFGRKKSVSQRT